MWPGSSKGWSCESQLETLLIWKRLCFKLTYHSNCLAYDLALKYITDNSSSPELDNFFPDGNLGYGLPNFFSKPTYVSYFSNLLNVKILAFNSVLGLKFSFVPFGIKMAYIALNLFSLKSKIKWCNVKTCENIFLYSDDWK